MTTFLIAAALLVAAALAAVLLPLLKKNPVSEGTESSALSLQVLREQLGDLERENLAGTLDVSQYEREKAEIERRAIEDGSPGPTPGHSARYPVWIAVSVSTALIALTIGLYLLLGTPAALRPTTGQQQNAHAVTPQQIQAMVMKLAERLQDNPADGEGWLMLARSYGALGQFAEASAAFGRATNLLPVDAQLLADYADTLAMAQGRRLSGDPEAIIKRALAADPKNIKALALSGSAAFEHQNYAVAIGEWRKALAIVPPDSTVAERIRTSIADAETRSGVSPGAGRVADTKPSAVTNIRGTVTLDSALRSKVAATDTLFIFARAVSGPRMPLAIKRVPASELPTRFVLDDSMGMPGGPKLSDHQQIIVGARISKSGDATPHPGDLEGLAPAVSLGAQDIRVTISTEITR